MAAHEDSTRLDELLRRRTELDRRLARYKQEFAVMFADIAGSTSFFERRGDVSGLVMVQELVDGARRAVAPLGGQVVKSIGDAVLVRFGEAGAAVRGAVALQESFAEWNRNRAQAERMRLRVGVSWGSGFVKDEDVFGDVGNLAGRKGAGSIRWRRPRRSWAARRARSASRATAYCRPGTRAFSSTPTGFGSKMGAPAGFMCACGSRSSGGTRVDR